MCIFADIISNLDGFKPGYSLGLTIAAWVFNVIAGILLNIDARSILYLDPQEAAVKGGLGMV